MKRHTDKFSLIILIVSLSLVLGIITICSLKFVSRYNKELIDNRFSDAINVENDMIFHDEKDVKTWCPNQYNQQSRLFYLCKVWGFAKYFSANENIDELLLVSLKNLLNDNEKSKDDYCHMLEDLVLSFDNTPAKSQNPYKHSGDYSLTSNEWIKDTICLNEYVGRKLEELFYNYDGNNHFAKNRRTGIVVITKTNNEQDFSNPYVRLFGLFDYWNAINYFYPNKILMDCCWDSILYEAIPQFVEADNEWQYRRAIYKLTNTLRDSHASYPASVDTFVFGEFRPEFRMAFIDSVFVINELRSIKHGENNFNIGDVIMKIGDEDSHGLFDSLGKFVCGGNYWSNQYFICNAMLSRKEKSTDFVILREQDTLRLNSHNEKSKKLWKRKMHIDKQNESSLHYRWINDKVAYLDLKSLTHKNFQDNYIPIKNADTLILDLRCYPEQLLAVDIADYFVPSNSTFASFIYADARFPGMLRIHKQIKKVGTNKCFKGKIIVLVNENTGSYSEYLTMMIQANPNTKVLGMPTSGAVGNVVFYNFPGKVTTAYTGVRVVYPSLKEVQRIGVKLDDNVLLISDTFLLRLLFD